MIDAIKYYYERFGIHGLTSAAKAKFTNSEVLICVDRQDVKFPFYLRCGTSDTAVFDQVFLNREYDFMTQRSPKIILDAGANIGLSSIFFTNKFPEAKILAIEPEKSNYEMLKMNVAQYSNISTLNVALWNKNEEINLIDPGLGDWGFTTTVETLREGSPGEIYHKVQGMTLDRIMEIKFLKRIDILKMDIEGAEREVFMDSSSWIDKIDALIIELHEQMKPGCDRIFYRGLKGFDNEWTRGENVFLSKNKSMIMPLSDNETYAGN